MTFLTAEWRKLAFANYPVEASVLAEYVPAGTELDTWEGRPYVSLIGFMFRDVRLLGVKVPFHVNFEEVNLRFYVRRRVDGQWRRGVVFVKEIVPKPAITFVANTLYGEAYETRPMWHRWTETDQGRRAQYQWRVGERWQTFSVTAERQATAIPEGGAVEFITEHYWGYSRKDAHRTTEYQVAHPRWEKYRVREHTIEVDFALNYGDRFAFLNSSTPDSVFLAEGSPIQIMGKQTLRFSDQD
ncbi:YqjF family protein [Lewinella sp. IMCC34183]|uniref:YqjF family protein n=1 Tax=Lewinella sp. IMCC34183 TaxID=2248762 RepID=UPI000E26AABE|nr:DUF2071 domain-containing protein [Lewinella sp. IMCC34183]